jgi:2-oxoglutarate ferredoxin oxidoreductase subunit gamma
MMEELIVAGFGGQGVLSLGMTLAYAGMTEGKEISWMPSYGPEMRGGTANCITIISDKKISSPIISFYDSAIILNQPSMDKFAAKVKPGGILLYDADNIIKPSIRSDINIISLPASSEAIRMKNAKIMNMIILGAYLRLKPVVKKDSILEALKKVLPEKYHHLLDINKLALEKGETMVRRVNEAELVN